MEVGAILEGNVVDIAQQPELDLQPTAPQAPQVLVPEVQPTFEGFETQLPLTQAADQPNLHDRFGQLRISRLREHFPRVPVVEGLAASRRFMHWQLCFADVLLQRGGFDLILGNPPWLKVEWNESGVLGEFNPLFAIRNFRATELAHKRTDAFNRYGGLQQAWTVELEEAEGMQCFLMAVQNYPVLNGVQTNLYKCFMPVAWALAGPNGVVGLLHPEGPYDHPNGGTLREALYRRLRLHFGFINELQLFAEVDHHTKYSVNIYGSEKYVPAFDQLANLFTPITVDACYQNDGMTSFCEIFAKTVSPSRAVTVCSACASGLMASASRSRSALGFEGIIGVGFPKRFERDATARVLKLDGIALHDFGDAPVAYEGGELAAYANLEMAFVDAQVLGAEDRGSAVALEPLGAGGKLRAQFAERGR